MYRKKIYINAWLDLKPYEKQTATDSYYLKISNEVKNAIITHRQSFVLLGYLDNDGVNFLACFLTSYFEDIISETNIWNSFVKTHQTLYKKQLPFYILDEYFEEEINLQDVCFLIWYFLNTFQEEKFIAPFNDFIIETAEEVMNVFARAWDYAPENEYLKSFYQIDENEDDFYVARQLIDTILLSTYLFYTDTFLRFREQAVEIIKKIKDEERLAMYLKENRDNTVHRFHTRLLSLKGKEWASIILGNKHKLSKEFLRISQKIEGLFLYKGQDHKNVFIEHIASGKRFDITKKSIDFSDTFKKVDKIMFMGIAKWKDEWWFSGIFFTIPYKPDLILNEKNSFKSRMNVSFLDYQAKETNEVLEMQLSAFKKYNNGSQIAFLPSNKIKEFHKGYIKFFNDSLNLTKKEIKGAKQRIKDDGFSGTKDGFKKDYSKISETGLVFLNPKSGFEIALAVNSAFPLPSNPYYKEEDSEVHVMRLLMDESLSTELAKYCIYNCKDKLPFFNKGIGKEYLEDIDFLLRFWKKGHYHSFPTMTLVGKKKKTANK